MGRIVGAVIVVLVLAGCSTGATRAGFSLRGGLEQQLPQVTLLDPARPGSAATFHGRNADNYFLKSDNAKLDVSQLLLDSEPGELSWAIYDFPGIRFDLAESTLLISHTAQAEGTLYIAFANYDRNAWEFASIEVEAGARAEELPIPKDSPYVSGGDACYIAIVTWDGLDTLLGEIDIAMGVENAAPQNLTAGDGTHAGFILVDWDPVPYAMGYLVEYRPQSGGEEDWAALSTPPGLPHYQYGHVYTGEPGSDPQYGVPYIYRVRTYFPDGDISEYSNTDSGYRSIPAPQNVRATYNIYVGKIEIQWDEVQAVSGYEVFRKHYAESEYSHLTTTSETVILDETVPDADLYDYAVLAFSTEGDGPLSEPAQGSALGFEFSDFMNWCDTPPDIRMMEMSGRIAVGYFDTRYDDLYFAHATTLKPIGMSSWLHFDLNAGEDSGEVCLGLLADNKPAVAARLSGSGNVVFCWSDESVPMTSPDWTLTVVEGSGTAVGRPSWVVAGANPALTIHADPTGSAPGLYYFYTDVSHPAASGDWQKYPLEEGFGAGAAASMQLSDGLPVVIANHQGFDKYVYHAAANAAPTGIGQWTTSDAQHVSMTARNIELLMHNGLPVCAMSIYLYAGTEYWIIDTYRAKLPNPGGFDDWQDTGMLYSEDEDIGMSLDLAIVNDRPAMCYYDEGSRNLMLAMSKTTNPGVDDWVVNTVADGTDVGRSCALMEYLGVPVLLYWDAASQKIIFAQGE